MTQTTNEQLLDAIIRHQVYLTRYSATVRNRINSILNKTEAELAMRIRDQLRDTAGVTTSVEWKRLQALLASLEGVRREGWDAASAFLLEDLEALAYAEPIVMDDLLKELLLVEVTTVMPTPNMLKSIALSRPMEGRILKDWADSMAAEDVRRIHTAVQAGMVAGEDSATIARRVVGTGALLGADGVTQMTRRQVEAVVGTAVSHVANGARNEYFKGNADIVSEEQFIGTLDNRTTPICRANDGMRYPLGKGPIPPLHFRCRSLRVAVIDGTLLGDRPAKPVTEKMLVKEFAKKNDLGDVTSRADLPRGVKGAYDAYARKRVRELTGPVPASETYQTWLKKQSHDFQDEILGVEKAKLFRDGDLTLDKFVDMASGREFTLDELRGKYPSAFAKAGAKTPGSGGSGPMSAPQTELMSMFGPPKSGTGLTIWQEADRIWKDAGSPKDPSVVVKLRKDMMDLLEQKHGIKRTTSSTTLGQWMKDRLEGGVVLPDLPPLVPKVVVPPAPKPVPKKPEVLNLRKLPPDEDQDVLTNFHGYTVQDLNLPRLPSYTEVADYQNEMLKLAQYVKKFKGKVGEAEMLGTIRETFIRIMTETAAEIKAAEKAAKAKAEFNLFALARKDAPVIHDPNGYTSAGTMRNMVKRQQDVWDVLPNWMTNILSDVRTNTLPYDGRAFYQAADNSINMAPPNGRDIYAHEWFHAVDYYFRRTNTGFSKYRGSLNWKTGDDTLDALAAAAGQEFKRRDSRGKGRFTNGDGDYMLGDWDHNYEARMYSWDIGVSCEYITMAAQKYVAAMIDGPSELDYIRKRMMRKQPDMVALLDYMFREAR